MDMMEGLLKDAFNQMVKEEYDRRPPNLKEHRFSLKFRWKMHRMIQDIGRKPQEADNIRGDSIIELYRPVTSRRRFAVLVLLLMMLIGGTVVAAEPLIRWLYNHYIEQYTDHVKVMNQEENVSSSNTGFQKYKMDVPEGYHLEGEEFDEIFQEYRLSYVNEEGKVFFLVQTRQENGNLGNITSGTAPLDEVKIGSFTGYYITDGSVGSLVLSDGNYMVAISGQFSKKVLMELADSLELKKN